jgi:hypothetical protein
MSLKKYPKIWKASWQRKSFKTATNTNGKIMTFKKAENNRAVDFVFL